MKVLQSLFFKFFRIKYVLLLFFLFSILIIIDVFPLFYNKNELRGNSGYLNSSDTDKNKYNDQNIVNYDNFNILVIADSHLNTKAFPKIREIALKSNVRLIVHLGDHTNFGSKEELKTAFDLLKSLNFDFVALPGDRDLAAAGGDEIFYSIFNKVTTLSIENNNLLFIDNSPNFTLLSSDYLTKIINEIPKSNIIFMSQPIFVNKGNIMEAKYMGSPNAFNFSDQESIENQKLYLNQRNKILNQLRISGNKIVITGDHHRSSKFLDPENKSVTYFIAGATSEYLNSNGISISQRSFQTERVSVISIDKNLTFSIHEIELFGK